MTIDELLAAVGLTANDEIPIWDIEATGEPTKKITAANLASAVVALANLVTGVKGNNESDYRHGNVNLTPANIGAVANAGGRMTGNLSIGKTTPAILFYNNNTDTTWAGIVYEVVDSGGNNRLAFAIRKDGSAGQEAYFLPAPDTHSAQTNYEVLTTKNLVSVNQGGTGANNAATARSNLGITPANIHAAYAINIASDVSEWSGIFQALNVLPTSTPGVIYAGSDPASKLTGGKLTSYIKGVVTRVSDNIFDFMVQRGGNTEYMYGFRVTGLTSSAGTPGTVYRFAGTAI